MIIAAVDPGKTGAIVLLEDGMPIDFADFVTVKVGKKTVLNMPLIANYVRKWPAPDVAYIERVHAMPKQGVSSTFDFGKSTGFAYGMFAAWGVRIEELTPQAWLKATGIGTGKGKDASRLWATNKWPQHAKWFARKKDNGRSDACAIGYAGWLIEKQNYHGEDLL